MPERPHRSIGEVLALLQGEFADITISKIRFLESQGLIDPERTPSGYRRFYDDDIDTLRWILRQQRESFLPLKVIKDRLDANHGQVPPEDRPALWTSPLAGLSATTGHHAGHLSGGAGADPAENDGRRTVTLGPGGAPPAGSTPGVSERSGDPTAPDRGPAESSASMSSDGAAKPVVSGIQNGMDAHRRPTAPYASRFMPDPGSVSLTATELASSAGLTAERIAELERFGLIASRVIGTDRIYDDEALVVAKLASSFLAHGIEPRHLRMYKVAAERESGVLAQVVAPLVRQRSAGRSAAVVRLEELATLGDAIRDAMLRQALRDLLL